MREELLKSNQELWRQAEERKRLNEVFFNSIFFRRATDNHTPKLYQYNCEAYKQPAFKLKQPISTLQNGISRIRNHDLDFSMPVHSDDELGQLCTAFDTSGVETDGSNAPARIFAVSSNSECSSEYEYSLAARYYVWSMEEHLHWKTEKVMAQRLLLLSK